MAITKAQIRKIRLSNGSEYSILDQDAIRLNNGTYPEIPDEVLITGNGIVDKAIIAGSLYITAIDDVPVSQAITNVLVQGTGGKIQKRSTDKLLEDIGGVSYEMDNAKGVLKLKIGK